MTNLDSHFYGMYDYLLGRYKEVPDVRPGETYTQAKMRIQRALFWLREHNLLYDPFYSHYDTLYRFAPGKVVHLNKSLYTKYKLNVNIPDEVIDRVYRIGKSVLWNGKRAQRIIVRFTT